MARIVEPLCIALCLNSPTLPIVISVYVYIYIYSFIYLCGPGSSVDIATGYGLDGPGFESWWGRDFPHLSRPGLQPTQSPVQWVPGLSQGYKSAGA
jgi:hypothetical protein